MVYDSECFCFFFFKNCNFGFATHLFTNDLKPQQGQTTAPKGVLYRISPTPAQEVQRWETITIILLSMILVTGYFDLRNTALHHQNVVFPGVHLNSCHWGCLKCGKARVVTRLCSVVTCIWPFERVVWFFSTNQSTVLNKKILQYRTDSEVKECSKPKITC